MYSREDELRAIELFVKGGLSPTAFTREIGYPVRGTLYAWYDEYIRNGADFPVSGNHRRYTEEQKRVAIDYFLHTVLSCANDKSAWTSSSRASCNMDRQTGAQS